MTEIESSFQGTLCRLILFSPFSFNLLAGMNISQSKAIDTMGVSVKNGRISLVYNPEFFESLEENERTFVLIHEMMHVLLHHCTHRMSSDPCRAYKENVAMDLAINCMIQEDVGIKMPRFKEDVGNKKKGDVQCLLPSQFSFRNGLSSEQYLALLDNKYPDMKVVFVSSGDGDKDSDISEDCPLGKITKGRIGARHGEGFDEDAFIDDYVRNVVEQIERNHQWGHLDSHAIEMVKKAQEQPLNWGDILRLKVGSFISFERTPSRRRWNKHYGKPFLGSASKSVEPVAVYADTSGSVGSADLSRFIVEIERLAHYTGVFLWSFDTQVHSPDDPMFFNRMNIESIEFKGRGGTCFSPVFEHAKEKGINKVIVLTDGVAEEITAAQVEGLDVVWVIVKGGDVLGKPGIVLEMDR